MLKTLIRASAVSAAAVLAVSLPAQAAPAATGYARCPAGYFCIFADPNGYGTIAYFKYGSPDLRQQGIDNAASSVWNRNVETFALCDGYNRVGNLYDIFFGGQGNLPPGVDNQASSVAMYAHGCA